MLLIKMITKWKMCTKGFSLVELIIVVCIIAILSAIAIPTYSRYIGETKKKTCNFNCLQLGKMYNGYLLMEGKEHSGLVFDNYVQEYGKDVCSDNNNVVYDDGNVRCSVHNMNEGENDGEVPYL